MTLNFALLSFVNSNYSIYRIDYIDQEQLNKLRREHNLTNSFFRHGNHIYHSPMVDNNAFFEGERVDFSVEKDIEITKKLLHHLIFRTILNTNSIITEFNPIEFFIRDKKYDLIGGNLSKDESTKVGYWKGFSIDTRTIVNNGLPNYGLLLNVLHS